MNPEKDRRMNTARYHSDEPAPHNRITPSWNRLSPTQPSTLVRNQVFEQAHQEDQEAPQTESNQEQSKQDPYYQSYQPDTRTQTTVPPTPSSLSEEEELTMELMEGFSDDFVPQDRIIDTPTRQFWDLMQQRADYVLSMHKTVEAERQALKNKQRLTELPTHNPVALTRLRILADEVPPYTYGEILDMPPVPRQNKLHEKTADKKPKPESDLGSHKSMYYSEQASPPSENKEKIEHQSTASQSNSDSSWLDYVSNLAGATVNMAKESGQSLVEDVKNYARSGNVVKDVARVSSDAIKLGKETYNAIAERSQDLSDNIRHNSSQLYKHAGETFSDAYGTVSPVITAVEHMSDEIGMPSVGAGLRDSYNHMGKVSQEAYNELGDIASDSYRDTEQFISEKYRSLGDYGQALLDQYGVYYTDALEIAQGAENILYENQEEVDEIINAIEDEVGKMSLNTAIIVAYGAALIIDDPGNAPDTLSKMGEFLLKQPASSLQSFKKKFGSDVVELAAEPVNWVKDNRRHFIDAQDIFDASYSDLRASALSISEEMNRNQNVLNRLGSYLQDAIIDKYGVVVSLGEHLRPDIGHGNIYTGTARDIVEKLKNHPKAHTNGIQEIIQACHTEETLARYLLTERGTIMIATAVMTLDISDLHPFIENVKDEDDRVQLKVNRWREGPSQEIRLIEGEKEAQKNGMPYIPKHGYEDDGSNPNAGAHKRNLRKIDEALALLPEFSEQ